jgi:hypothetical protein
MDKNDDDYYERQTELLEKFLSKNDKTAFMKMLNMNINPNADKEKENHQKKRPDFMKSMKNKSPHHIYDRYHMNQYNNTHNNDDLFSYNNNYRDNQVNNYKLNFHNILQDPEYKDKSMKGNYKWGSMKFQMIKQNLAKRRGVSIDDLQMPKVADRKRNKMEMNGQFVMSNNPLTQSLNLEKKKLSEISGLRNSLKIKMGKINQENGIRRQLTQKVKPAMTLDGINEINDIDFNFS